jgi:hypothetical protein
MLSSSTRTFCKLPFTISPGLPLPIYTCLNHQHITGYPILIWWPTQTCFYDNKTARLVAEYNGPDLYQRRIIFDGTSSIRRIIRLTKLTIRSNRYWQWFSERTPYHTHIKTHKLQQTCSRFVAMLFQQLVNRICSHCLFPACWQVVNGLFTTNCYKVVELNRLVTSCSNNLLSSCNSTICQQVGSDNLVATW